MPNTLQSADRFHLLDKVIDGEYCVGCGGCAFVANKKMVINAFGEYVPEPNILNDTSEDQIKKMAFVCPSLNPEFNEDVLAQKFLGNGDNQSDKIGTFFNVYGGYVKEGNLRTKGTSGGFGTWFGVELLRLGLIDAVIHVKEYKRQDKADPYFKYGISTTVSEVQQGSKTKYHVVEMSEILQLVKANPGKYLFMGLPCMVKAMRRVQLVDPVIAERIKYTAALVCGHLKSINWTRSLAWAKGVDAGDIDRFQYRTKEEGISARAYVFKAFYRSPNGPKEVMEDSGKVVGGKFNQGALMLPACNFCDDLVGETADITIGDAWLPQYEIDSDGTNLLIIRNQQINEILATALSQDRITLDLLSEKDAIEAQSGGFRQRREGLSYRLKLQDDKRTWRPEKRVLPEQFSPPLVRKMIYRMRSQVTARSRKIFKSALDANDYSIYRNAMYSQLKALRFLEVTSSIVRIVDRRIAYFKLRRLKG